MNKEQAKVVFIGATVCGFVALFGALTFPIPSWRRWSLILVAICSLVGSLTNIELGRGEEEAPSGRRWRMVSRLDEVTFWLALIVLILLA